MTDKRTELKGKDKFLAGLTSFLEKNKNLLLIILAVFIVAIVVVAIVDSSNQKKANESAIAIEEVQKEYDKWLALEDDDSEKDSSKNALVANLDALITDNYSKYAKQRALFIKANIKFNESEWADSAALFNEAAEINRDSYLAPISLMLSGSSYENAANYAAALKIYIDVYDNYDKIYPDVPRTMLSIGRLYEQTGDTDSAIEAYNNLLDNYPGSGWASFARTRIIQLD